MRILIVTAVREEADAVGPVADALVIPGGIGRANAAAATTEAILRHGPFTGVLNTGIAGLLPGSGLSIGDTLVATGCCFMEEGIITPTGFSTMESMGFTLGDFPGNVVPVDPRPLARAASRFRTGVIATVATCSGTDAAAEAVVERTGALAEAMEGAAVAQAAGRLGLPASELRVMSNTTGDRDAQIWDIPIALARLPEAVRAFLEMIDSAD